MQRAAQRCAAFFVGRIGIGPSKSLPLTLTLSPLAGRGDVPHEMSAGHGEFAAISVRPASGEKVQAGG
ncbi:hypothetical protein CO674_15730 [Rhizobium hidalgonense]|uniref:Uncharacterized protein n=1 Tax=Rhizobium hidalgonense TaxID=1538159 RepID=A0ABX4JRV4_9HYPH|nr:hypothetical protein CO674_15730 [Rhizobium hidalgonense]PON09166.1 hypothetical protein ATY29_01495 [Rhizobium hidalgonense]